MKTILLAFGVLSFSLSSALAQPATSVQLLQYVDAENPTRSFTWSAELDMDGNLSRFVIRNQGVIHPAIIHVTGPVALRAPFQTDLMRDWIRRRMRRSTHTLLKLQADSLDPATGGRFQLVVPATTQEPAHTIADLELRRTQFGWTLYYSDSRGHWHPVRRVTDATIEGERFQARLRGLFFSF